MSCALTRRLSLVRLRRPRRHVWRRPSDGVLLGRRLRRMVGLPRLLLRLRTRRGSGVLCRLWTRSVVYLRRWLWRPRCNVLLGRRLRRMAGLPCLLLRLRTRGRGLVHPRGRSGLPRVVIRTRNVIVLRRSRHVLRSACLLVVLRMRNILRCTRLLIVLLRRWSSVVRGLRWPIYGRKSRPHCFTSAQSSRPWRRDYSRTSLIARHKLGGVTLRRLLVLRAVRMSQPCDAAARRQVVPAWPAPGRRPGRRCRRRAWR